MLFRPLATPVGVVLLAALMGDRHSEGVQARSPAFFQKAHLASFGVTDVASSQNSLARSIINDFPRGGAEGDEESEEAHTEVLYLPGLLEVELVALDQVSFVETFSFRHYCIFSLKGMNSNILRSTCLFFLILTSANCKYGFCRHVVR